MSKTILNQKNKVRFELIVAKLYKIDIPNYILSQNDKMSKTILNPKKYVRFELIVAKLHKIDTP